jgi:hypothetical protein
MQKWWQKILLYIVVAPAMGHTFVPHHHDETDEFVHHQGHHDKQDSQPNHHDHEQDKDDHHSIFSIAQLDKDFVPVLLLLQRGQEKKGHELFGFFLRGRTFAELH